MEYTTIKDYAESRKITYEAVSRQVRQYKKKELKGHLKYQGRLILLDETAIDFLDQHRMKRNIVLSPTSDEIKRDISHLQQELAKVMQERDQLKNTIISMQQEQKKYIEDKARADVLLEIADKERHELEQTRQQLKESERERERQQEQHQQELNKYKPTLFGLYRKTE